MGSLVHAEKSLSTPFVIAKGRTVDFSEAICRNIKGCYCVFLNWNFFYKYRSNMGLLFVKFVFRKNSHRKVFGLILFSANSQRHVNYVCFYSCVFINLSQPDIKKLLLLKTWVHSKSKRASQKKSILTLPSLLWQKISKHVSWFNETVMFRNHVTGNLRGHFCPYIYMYIKKKNIKYLCKYFFQFSHNGNWCYGSHFILCAYPYTFWTAEEQRFLK